MTCWILNNLCNNQFTAACWLTLPVCVGDHREHEAIGREVKKFLELPMTKQEQEEEEEEEKEGTGGGEGGEAEDREHRKKQD